MAIEICMPPLDAAMTKARVVAWKKSEGEPVLPGDTLVEIETEKAVVEVEAEAKGLFGKALVAEGEYAAVNAVIGLLLEEGESAKALEAYSAPAPTASAESPAADATVTATDNWQKQKTSVPLAEQTRIFASPLARRLAGLEGLDLGSIKGSGPNGRIVKRDIEAMLAQPRVPSIQAVEQQPHLAEIQFLPAYETIKLTAMRQTIARRLTESSQQVPHYFLTLDCELDKLLDLRKQLNDDLDPEAKLSLNDFIIKAVALAMKKVPAANVMWGGDSILRFDHVDISVAVAIAGGLITPVVRHADSKGLVDIAKESKTLAGKARDGKLVPEDYRGGTFTISNLGMQGIKHFTSIINPPQAGILSVGAGEQRPVVKNGELAIATVMTVTLAADHRCIDGAVGAEFLGTFRRFIEAPLTILQWR